MDSQDLVGLYLMLDTLGGDLTLGKRNLEILLKLIAEDSETRLGPGGGENRGGPA